MGDRDLEFPEDTENDYCDDSNYDLIFHCQACGVSFRAKPEKHDGFLDYNKAINEHNKLYHPERVNKYYIDKLNFE